MMVKLVIVTQAETEKRRIIARRIVDALASATELRAAMLAGSVARGTSDEHSDIDLITYYDTPPGVDQFDPVMQSAGAEPIGFITPPGQRGFGARYKVEGIEVQTGPSTVAELESRLQRIEAGDVDWINAKVASGLLEGVPMHGEELIRRWQARAAYPESLRRREVEANLGWFPIWVIDDHLAARDAELFRRQMLLEGAFRVVAVLSAVNRLYFTTFQFKRAREHSDQMAVKPNLLAERLDRVANASPSVAAQELRTLVEETKAIVRSEMGHVNVEAPWQPPKG
jgi:hypothetical protein